MKAVPGWLIQTGAPFAEIIGAAIDSDGSTGRRNQTRAMPAWIGGTCDMASATVGPDRQQMSGLKARLGPLVPVRRLMPTNALSSGFSVSFLSPLRVGIWRGRVISRPSVR